MAEVSPSVPSCTRHSVAVLGPGRMRTHLELKSGPGPAFCSSTADVRKATAFSP